jgi:quinol monooxygenase YgiN
MIIATLRFSVMPDSRREFIQTVAALMCSMEAEKGCMQHSFYQDLEDQNRVVLTQEWASEEDLNRHLRSDIFAILLGAIELLTMESAIRFDFVSSSADGFKAVEAIRTFRSEDIEPSVPQ